MKAVTEADTSPNLVGIFHEYVGVFTQIAVFVSRILHMERQAHRHILHIEDQMCIMSQKRLRQALKRAVALTREAHTRNLHIEDQVFFMSQKRMRETLKRAFLVMQLGIAEEFIKIMQEIQEQRRLDTLAWILFWMSPNIQSVSPMSTSVGRETKRGPPSYPELDLTDDVSGKSDEQDIGERSEITVDDVDGGAFAGCQAGARDTEAEGSRLSELLLFLEVLSNSPHLPILPMLLQLPELQRTSTEAPTDGTGSDNRFASTGENAALGKRTHTEKPNSRFHGGGQKGKKKIQARRIRWQRADGRLRPLIFSRGCVT
jgi:hypothetical protein